MSTTAKYFEIFAGNGKIFSFLWPIFKEREKFIPKLPYYLIPIARTIMRGICREGPYPPLTCEKKVCQMTTIVLEASMKKNYTTEDLKKALSALNNIITEKHEEKIYQSFYRLVLSYEIAKLLFFLHHPSPSFLRMGSIHREEFFRYSTMASGVDGTVVTAKDPLLRLPFVLYILSLYMKCKPLPLLHVMTTLNMALYMVKRMKPPIFFSARIEATTTILLSYFDELCAENSQFDDSWSQEYLLVLLERGMEHADAVKLIQKDFKPVLTYVRRFRMELTDEFSFYDRKVRVGIGRFCNYCHTEAREVGSKKWRGFKLCRKCYTAWYCSKECEEKDNICSNQEEGEKEKECILFGNRRHGQFCQYLMSIPSGKRLTVLKGNFGNYSTGMVCEVCALCLRKMMRCGKCKSTWYCSKECQRIHWRAGHRDECGRKILKIEEEKKLRKEGLYL